MSYTYDSLNRLSSVTDRLGTSNYTYDGASNVSTVTYPNGVQTDYQQYDAMNRILQMATQNSGYIYQRGPTGNLTSVTEQNGRAGQWSFDGLTLRLHAARGMGSRVMPPSTMRQIPCGLLSFSSSGSAKSGKSWKQTGRTKR